MIQNKTLFIVLIRLFLGYIFFSAGVCKLTHGQFGQLIGPPWLEESLAEYGLGLFAQVVAIAQVICGSLLLSQRFSLLGAIMLVPMNVAILAVTVSMNWVGTPFVNAVFLLLNFVLLGLEHQKFHFLFRPMQVYTLVPSKTDAIGLNKYSWIGLAFCLITLAMTFVSITLTNVFALLAFAGFALTIVHSGIFKLQDVALLILPFLAMAAVTLGGMLQIMLPVTVILVAEALLLSYRLYLGRRRKDTKEQLVPIETRAV